jgi:hypothetical protein
LTSHYLSIYTHSSALFYSCYSSRILPYIIFFSLLISPFQLANINMKFSAIIAIAVIAVVASLAMVDATPILDRRASASFRPLPHPLPEPEPEPEPEPIIIPRPRNENPHPSLRRRPINKNINPPPN